MTNPVCGTAPGTGTSDPQCRAPSVCSRPLELLLFWPCALQNSGCPADAFGFFLFVCFPGSSHRGEGTSVVQQVSWDHRSKPCTSTSGREEMRVRCENSPFFSVCAFSICQNVPSSLLAALIDEIPVGCKRKDIIYLWCGLTVPGRGHSFSAPQQPRVPAVQASQANPRAPSPPQDRPSH